MIYGRDSRSSSIERKRRRNRYERREARKEKEPLSNESSTLVSFLPRHL